MTPIESYALAGLGYAVVMLLAATVYGVYRYAKAVADRQSDES